MNGDAMGLQVVAAMSAVTIDIVDGDSAATIEAKLSQYRLQLMQAMCGAIVLHIQTQAVVTSSVAVASVTAVTVGAGVSGPGVGTATGTVT